MKTLIHSLRLPLVGALAVLSIGCATPRYPGQSPSAIITVNNERTTLNHLTIYLVPSLGTPERLGTVDLNRSRNFTISASSSFSPLGSSALVR